MTSAHAGRAAEALGPAPVAIPAYEKRLGLEMRWALAEGSRFFEERSAVQDTLRNIVRRLDEIGVPYVVVGGLALFAHGFRRFTEDVDLLVTEEGLQRIHKELEGLGYVPPFKGSKHLRDAQSGVRIEFLVTGQFPGDGKPKAVAFPDPAAVAVEKDGIKYLALPTLIELKLASGISNALRLKDISDVIELVKLLDLPKGFSDQLSAYVREKYLEIWRSVQEAPRRFMAVWRNKFLTVDAKTIEEMVAALRNAADRLDAMRADGVTLDPEGGTADDYAHLITGDPAVAKKYDMHDEQDFLADGREDTTDAPESTPGNG